MASLGDLVRAWHLGAQAVERGDWARALRLFSGVPAPPARLCFNAGCVHLLAGDAEAALRAFDQAVTKDTYMAIGFFQRGVANFQLGRFQEALSDFQLALVQLRGHAAIDYTQLGLRFKLQAWEVLYNVASAQCQLGLWTEAASSLRGAMSNWPEGSLNGLESALDQVQRQSLLPLRQVPRGEVFRPHRRHLDHLEPMDFLGKAKMLPATVAWQTRARWCPLPSLTTSAGPSACSSRRDSARAGTQQGALHAETEVSADSCTLAAHREQVRAAPLPTRGRSPSCFLRPGTTVEPAPGQREQLTGARQGQPDGRAQMEQDGRPTPLSPGLPAMGVPGPSPSEDPAAAGEAGSGCAEPLVTVTVQCAFTVALTARRGADLSSLRALLSQALPRQAQLGQLRWGRALRWAPPWLRQLLEEGVAEVPVLPAGPTHTAPLRNLFAVTKPQVRMTAGSPSPGRSHCRGHGWTRLPAPGGCSCSAGEPGAAQSSTRWWPSMATQLRGQRTWTSDRGPRWTSCVKWTRHGWKATVTAASASSPSASWFPLTLECREPPAACPGPSREISPSNAVSTMVLIKATPHCSPTLQGGVGGQPGPGEDPGPVCSDNSKESRVQVGRLPPLRPSCPS
ncbi:NADPH oxidase activator 1 isoform X2 [Sapajus apella]|uniref:NADPH oxidase activator 1 isoform X2 n=1 Tax=Sapajus apella TaxID=9515 RepID=A0A6J3GIG1_SAPAP|nr:NADPH oxidase activator 1 isoform X2 [Sapajus apella]